MAICQAHELHGFPSPRKAPEVTEVLQGIRSTIGVGPELERLVTGVVLIRR